MKFFRFFLPFPILIFAALSLQAMNNHTHDDHHHDHVHHKYHLGLGLSAAKVLNEDIVAPALHLHFIRQFGHHYQFGLGLGYEGIASDDWHNSLNLLFNYRPLHYLSLLAGPGISFAGHDGHRKILPAFQSEIIFEFNLRGLHLGPMLGLGFDKHDAHISAGLHIGIGF